MNSILLVLSCIVAALVSANLPMKNKIGEFHILPTNPHPIQTKHDSLDSSSKNHPNYKIIKSKEWMQGRALDYIMTGNLDMVLHYTDDFLKLMPFSLHREPSPSNNGAHMKLNPIYDYDGLLHFLITAQSPEFIKDVLTNLLKKHPNSRYKILLKSMDYLTFYPEYSHVIIGDTTKSETLLKKFTILKDLGLKDLKDQLPSDALNRWMQNILTSHVVNLDVFANQVWKDFKI